MRSPARGIPGTERESLRDIRMVDFFEEATVAMDERIIKVCTGSGPVGPPVDMLYPTIMWFTPRRSRGSDSHASLESQKPFLNAVVHLNTIFLVRNGPNLTCTHTCWDDIFLKKPQVGMQAMSDLVLMSKSTHASHACQERFEGFLGSIVQVDVFIKHHLKVLEGVRARQDFNIIERGQL
eukprot:409713-Pelagomonas_calceolata.AAC.2